MKHAEIAGLIKQDFAEGVECGFNLYTLLRFNKTKGIYSKVGPGRSHIRETEGEPRAIRYAVCPGCHQEYYQLKDACSCLTGHTGKNAIDVEENKKYSQKRLSKVKAESVFQYGFTILMKKKYAVISISRTLAETFVTYSHPSECLIISSEKELGQIQTAEGELSPEYAVIFLGRPTNYLKHFSMEYDFIRRELERIEAIRDSKYIVKVGNDLIMSDEWDLEDLKGEVFTRTLIDGRPAYSKS